LSTPERNETPAPEPTPPVSKAEQFISEALDKMNTPELRDEISELKQRLCDVLDHVRSIAEMLED
jgi:hypothetical protein